MDWGIGFFFNSIFLGVGLAMDAFSVSIVNGLSESGMRVAKMLKVSGVYAFFQFLMPMIGWICVHTVVEKFTAFEPLIPWIALILLVFIGGKMLLEGLGIIGGGEGPEPVGETSPRGDDCGLMMGKAVNLTLQLLLIQGIATSIDALSVGFTIAKYGAFMALVCSVIIALVTWILCMTGLKIGIRVGEKFSCHATVFGGIVLIFIGIEIFFRGVFLS